MRPEDRPAIVALLSDPSIAEIWDTRGPEHSADELLAGEANYTVWVVKGGKHVLDVNGFV